MERRWQAAGGFVVDCWLERALRLDGKGITSALQESLALGL